jgi:hypothetical protein
MLAQARASAVLTDLDDNGRPVAISFRIKRAFGVLTIRLAARTAEVHKILLNSKDIPARLRTKEQAERVGWRIWLNWLEAQLALVEAETVQLEEVFLPFCQDQDGKTLYERMREARFAGLLLTDKT